MKQFWSGLASRRSAGAVSRSAATKLACLAPLVLALGACGGGGGGDGGDASSAQEPVTLGAAGPGDVQNHLPLAVGNSWQFRGTVVEGQTTTPTETTITVPGVRAVGGVSALVVRESVVAGAQTTAFEDAMVKDANGVAVLASADDVLNSALVPYWELRFPLVAGAEFVQIDRTDLDFGQDLDADGRNERVSLYATVRVVGTESVTVPAGTFAGSVHVQRRLELTLRLSADGSAFDATETGNAWYAPGVGWVRRTSVAAGMGETLTSDEQLTAYVVGGVARGAMNSASLSSPNAGAAGSKPASALADWRRALRGPATAP